MSRASQSGWEDGAAIQSRKSLMATLRCRPQAMLSATLAAALRASIAVAKGGAEGLDAKHPPAFAVKNKLHGHFGLGGKKMGPVGRGGNGGIRVKFFGSGRFQAEAGGADAAFKGLHDKTSHHAVEGGVDAGQVVSHHAAFAVGQRAHGGEEFFDAMLGTTGPCPLRGQGNVTPLIGVTKAGPSGPGFFTFKTPINMTVIYLLT
jgi:hypothetical protein